MNITGISDAVTREFDSKVTQIARIVQQANPIVTVQTNGAVMYKRPGCKGKAAIIDTDVILLASCRLCGKSHTSPFQARMNCCEAHDNIQWPVTCKSLRDDTGKEVTYHGSVPNATSLTFYCVRSLVVTGRHAVAQIIGTSKNITFCFE